LSVIVDKHLPESPDRGCRDLDAERGDVAFEESSDERLAPGCAVLDRRGEKRERKAAANPEFVEFVFGDFVRREGRDFYERDSSGETFGTLADEIARGAAQNQEAGWAIGPVNESAKNREQFRSELDLVDDDESSKVRECELRINESTEVGRIFEIEVVARRRVVRPFLDKGPCQSRLSTLAGAQECDDRGGNLECIVNRTNEL